MIASRHKVLGLALMAVLGLMALAAAGAQASEVGVFLLDGKAASNGTLTAALTDGTTELDTTVGANNVPVNIACKKIVLSNTKVNEKDIKGEAKFTECEVLEPKPCVIEEPFIVKALTLPLLHTNGAGTKTYLLFHPWEGTTSFATLHFTGCILLEEVEIKGLFALKDCEDAMLTEKETHLLEEVKLGLGEGLKFGAKGANLLGSSFWNTPGKKWSAH